MPIPRPAPAKAEGPLAGVRVIDASSVVMGPMAAQILGDMGADVVKVEPPGGDPFRSAPPMKHVGMGGAYLNLNRNKRSIALDLKSVPDRRILLDLLCEADVLIVNTRPAALARLQLDYASVRGLNERLIYCGTCGFSESGRYAGRPAYDDVIQAMAGNATLQSDAGGSPGYVNSVIADKVTALTAVYSISMALYERERSGYGQFIEVPMFETMVSFNLVEHLAGATFRPPIASAGYGRVLSPHRRPYRTLDGYLSVLPYTQRHWEQFFSICGLPLLKDDPRFADADGRHRFIDELYRCMAEELGRRTTAWWEDRLRDADIPVARVATLDDLLDDPHLQDIGFLQQTDHPTEGPILYPGIPVTFSRTPGSIRWPASRLDQDRGEIEQEVRAAWQARDAGERQE